MIKRRGFFGSLLAGLSAPAIPSLPTKTVLTVPDNASLVVTDKYNEWPDVRRLENGDVISLTFNDGDVHVLVSDDDGMTWGPLQ